MSRFLAGLALLCVSAFGVHAKSSTHSHAKSKPHNPSARKHASSNYCYSCARSESGRIKRSTGAKHRFQASHPCPSTGRTSGSCPGYVIDHVKPLKRGGEDKPSNMQWQTKEEAKKKDRVE